MTISRLWFLAVALLVTVGMAGAQSQPKDLPWAVSEFSGGGDWAVRFPQLLVRDWGNLPAHRLSDAEKEVFRRQFVNDTVRALDLQASRLQLDLDRKRLLGTLPSTEPQATNKALDTLSAKRSNALGGSLPGSDAPDSLTFRPVWSTGREGLPWPVGPRGELALKSKAAYLVTGTLRTVGSYFSAQVELYSTLEDRVLASWEGDFAVDEAPDRVAEVGDALRESLLGRPWSGIALSSPVAGARARVQGVWHNLPWSSDEMVPGTLDVEVQNPGHEGFTRSVDLAPSTRTSLTLETPEAAPDPLVVTTDPPGVALYIDSRYIGLSPQTVDRPLNVSRVRAQGEGWATAAWEVGPGTVSPSVMKLLPPAPLPSVPRAKDQFYLSLASFSFSLTGTAFLGAWWDEQFKLQKAYAAANPVSASNYRKAYDRYWWSGAAYAVGIGLTTSVFVWMMVELGDYLGAAQASLP